MPSDRRFLVLLPADGYYGLQAASIVRGLQAAGAGAVHVPAAVHVPDLPRPPDDRGIREALQRHAPTDVLTVNTPRRLLPLSSGTVHHCWVQDPYTDPSPPGTWGDRVWMWVSRWVEWWGGEFLPPATDYGEYPPEGGAGSEAEVSFAGLLPHAPVRIVGAPPGVEEGCQAAVQAVCRELERTRRFESSPGYPEALLERAQASSGRPIPEPLHPFLHRHIHDRLLRHVQRRQLLDVLVPLCGRRGWRLRLAGPAWTAPRHVGPVEPGPPLARFYRTSKINLHTNVYTNVHSRVLECLASGSLPLSQALSSDALPGGLRELFDEGTAPTYRSPEGLEARLEALLADDRAREEAVERGRALVLERHSYAARMRELISASPRPSSGHPGPSGPPPSS